MKLRIVPLVVNTVIFRVKNYFISCVCLPLLQRQSHHNSEREKTERERDVAEMNVRRERERKFCCFLKWTSLIFIFYFYYKNFFAAMSILWLFLLFFGRKGWGASHVFFVVRERENGKGHKSSFLQILSGQVHAHPELRRVHFRKLRISYICYVTSVS